ncbi:nuclear transport factor 2 family protein [Streptomyces avermitilis]|uniref:nuclear transport factor 2 family protein n=1 Tax=Streptomyces avermitilis TaxID=33903 RepID=UPI0033B61A87
MSNSFTTESRCPFCDLPPRKPATGWLRELIDAYAHCADRKDAKGRMALFTQDTRFLVYMDAIAAEPTQELLGRAALAPAFDNLNAYKAITHFNGRSTVSLDGDRAGGETYCPAHHISFGTDAERTIVIASIRCLDQFVRQGGDWFLGERPTACRLDRDPSLRTLSPWEADVS